MISLMEVIQAVKIRTMPVAGYVISGADFRLQAEALSFIGYAKNRSHFIS
jgi:hypothetical protein